ncbi:MAG: chorismate synthase [Bacteroidales bacterium]|nr:MAG: chorismate synthase [Bacteroidales bacterium]
MNSYGRIFRITVFGESHGPQTGINVDGCPPGIAITEDDFCSDLARRKSGKAGTTTRIESDMPKIVSGIYRGKATGSPITIVFENRDMKPGDYANVDEIPRPGHADFVAMKKYHGFADSRGGGHFSGRITLGLVAAGVIAKKIIHPIDVRAELIEAGGKEEVEDAVREAKKLNDSIGGIIECVAANMPVGLGEPFFDSIESVISHLAFSVPAIKGIEFGSGFGAAKMKGSEHNDPIISIEGKTGTNHAGGVNGGISNGNELVFRVAVKPASSTSQKQHTMNIRTGEMVDLEVKGRHDLCIALRVPVIIEAITSIGLADLFLQNLKAI